MISTHFGNPAGGSRPLIGSNLRNRRFPNTGSLCDLCGSSAPLRVPRSVRLVQASKLPLRRAASGHIVAGGDSPGPNLWSSSKLPSLQTSKLPGAFCGKPQKAPAETAGARARGYKPSSVPLRAPIIKLSTQPADSAEAVVGASSASPPIWACSGRGLPCAGAFTHRRWALTPPFHPYRPKAAVCLCGTFRRAGLPRAHRPLQPVFPLCGVRTFLPLARAIGHPGTKGG